MRPRLSGVMTALAFGAVVFVGGGVGNAASAGNDDRALLLEWQASCVARLKAAAREADGVEPGFSAATTISGPLKCPPSRATTNNVTMRSTGSCAGRRPSSERGAALAAAVVVGADATEAAGAFCDAGSLVLGARKASMIEET